MLIENALRCQQESNQEFDPTTLLSTLNILLELYLEDEEYQQGVNLIHAWRYDTSFRFSVRG